MEPGTVDGSILVQREPHSGLNMGSNLPKDAARHSLQVHENARKCPG
jgi:hypothetical protein